MIDKTKLNEDIKTALEKMESVIADLEVGETLIYQRRNSLNLEFIKKTLVSMKGFLNENKA